MKRKRFTEEQITFALRQAEIPPLDLDDLRFLLEAATNDLQRVARFLRRRETMLRQIA